jgi:glycosyltransferase involved in cell wall biosynthesis
MKERTLANTATVSVPGPGHGKLRVLLLVEMCNPSWTSVPLVGYNFARALATHPDLETTIVTQQRNRPALEADPLTRLTEVCFIDTEFVARPLYGLARWLRGGDKMAWTIDTAMAWPSYIVFEHCVHRRFARDLRAGRFDLIHRVTPLSPIMGSPLAQKTATPMLIGPLNGGLPWPKEYPELRRQEREWLIPLRQLYRLLPYYRSTYQHLAGVIVASRHTASEIPSYFRGRRYFLPENGVDPERFPLASDWPQPHGPFRFITVGRLVPLKAVDMILDAMRRSALLRGCRFQVVGDGPERPRLEGLAREYGLQESVEFLGWLEQRALGEKLRQAQAFVFPSLKDFGGGVVLEAMAAALPCIVVAYGGPGELVSEAMGIRLPMKPRAELTERLQVAMEQLAGDPERCRTLGRAAVEEVRTSFTWSAKADRIAGIYRDLLVACRGRALPWSNEVHA